MRLLIFALVLAISYAQTECLMRERRPSSRLDGEILVVDGQSFTVVTDITSCEAFCVHQHAPECNGFTYTVSTKRCFLKTSVTQFNPAMTDDDISSYCARDFGPSRSGPAPRPPMDSGMEENFWSGGHYGKGSGSGGVFEMDGPTPSSYVDTMQFSEFPQPEMQFPAPSPPLPNIPRAPFGTPRIMNCELLLSAKMCTRNRGCVWKVMECDNLNCEHVLSAKTCAQTPGCSWVASEMKCNDYEEGFAYKQNIMPRPGFQAWPMLESNKNNYPAMSGYPETEMESEMEYSNSYYRPGMGMGMRLKKTHVDEENKDFYAEDGSFQFEKWMQIKQSTCASLEDRACGVEKACEWNAELQKCKAIQLEDSSKLTEEHPSYNPNVLYPGLAFGGGLMFGISLLCIYRWRTSKKVLLAENAW